MAEEKSGIALAEPEKKAAAPAITAEKQNQAEKKESQQKNDTAQQKNASADLPNKSEQTELTEPEDEEIDMDDLFKRRPSIDLTPENAHFFRSKGGMISLCLHTQDSEENFERVSILRSFPITAPDEFLSVREPDSRKKGRGFEIGMIRYLHDYDTDTQSLIREELEQRYFLSHSTAFVIMDSGCHSLVA